MEVLVYNKLMRNDLQRRLGSFNIQTGRLLNNC
jgi:hypothetical protein